MIGSVSSLAASSAYTQAVGSTSQANTAPKPELNETKKAEKAESATMQLREPENSSQGAGLLQSLSKSETRNLPASTSQQNANTQANQVNAQLAYSNAGKSEFNFA